MVRHCLIAVAFTFLSYQVAPAEEPSPAGKLAFEKAEHTGLSEIVRNRRELLEKRQGKPLRGHAWWLWGLSGFDYDRDGDLDLVVCVHGPRNGMIIKNLLQETGKLRFEDVTIETGADGLVPGTDNHPLIWDFDGDGFLDIAGLFDDAPTTCLWNRGGKRFEKADFSLHPLNYPTPPKDYSDDGYLDIEQHVRGKLIRMIYRPQQKRFEKSVSDFTPPVTLPADFADELAQLKKQRVNRFLKLRYYSEWDLDGNGVKDTIVSGFGSYSGARLGRYLLAEADGTLTDRTDQLGLPREGTPCFFEDLDVDGDVDLLIASGERGGLYLNDGHGKFSHRPGPLSDFVKKRMPYLQRVFRADLDNDGDPDLAVSSRRLGRQRVFENLGEGKFREVLASSGWDADPMVIHDINQDGRLDVIIGGGGDKETIAVFLNATASAGNFCQVRLETKGPNRYAAGAQVEVFAAGALHEKNSHPIWRERAATDARPIHVGLGSAKKFDLRVTFPDGSKVEADEQSARHLLVTPQGVSAVSGD